MATIGERIKEILGDGALDIELSNIDTFEYSFTGNGAGGGYERLISREKESGELNFQGSYHPNGVCEGGGVCNFCGRTLEFN
jgi:hypothetical protein